MAAARYSQDVLEEFFGEIPRRESEPEEEEKEILNLDEAIQNLPPELREKINKELVAIKMMERKEKGWNEVHDEIEEAPFCEKQQRITKVCYCRKCSSCRINRCCYECIKKGEKHYLDLPYNENFHKFY